MEKKKCNKCDIEKDVTLFRKRKTSKDGLRNECKDCSYIVYKKYAEKNTDKLKQRKKQYNYNNFKKLKEKSRKYRLENLEAIREKERIRSRERYKNNPEYIKTYYENNKERLNRRKREKVELNPSQKERIREYKKLYFQKNKEDIKKRINSKKENNPEFVQATREYKRKYYQKNKKRTIELRAIRRQTDSFYNLTNSLRSRIKEYIKKRDFIKRNKTFDIVGCTPQQLKEHLEKQFNDGMSWENYGFYGWHIDHIIPLCSATTEDELYKLCHYTNLQPLWATENIKKGGKIL